MYLYNSSDRSPNDPNGSDTEDLENALIDYEDKQSVPLNDKYRCRDCGQLYNTIEAHDHHQRKVHHQTEKYPLEELPM